MGAEHIAVQFEPLFRVGLPWPPGELELIELILGFGEATPELVHLTDQAVTLLVEVAKVAGQPFDGPGQVALWSGFRRTLRNALIIAAKPGHWPTLAPCRPWDRLAAPRRGTQPEEGVFPTFTGSCTGSTCSGTSPRSSCRSGAPSRAVDVPASRTGKDGPPRRGRLGPH